MFYGPVELARLALVRADVIAADARAAERFEKETGYSTFVISGWRSDGEQAATYADSIKGGYRAAPADVSRHPLGAAIDRGIVGRVRSAEVDQADPLYRRLAEITRDEGLSSGYFWTTGKPDPYHREAKETLVVSKAKWAALVKERQRRAFIVGAVALTVAVLADG